MRQHAGYATKGTRFTRVSGYYWLRQPMLIEVDWQIRPGAGAGAQAVAAICGVISDGRA